jgi:hypothetical protein
MTKNLIPGTRVTAQIVDVAPAVAELYRELQTAQQALARMVVLIEQVASNLPPDDR